MQRTGPMSMVLHLSGVWLRADGLEVDAVLWATWLEEDSCFGCTVLNCNVHSECLDVRVVNVCVCDV